MSRMKKLFLALACVLSSCTTSIAADLYSFGYSPKGWPSETSPNQTAFYEFIRDEMGGKGALIVGGSWRDDTLGVSDCGGDTPGIFADRVAASNTYGFANIYIADWRQGNTLLMNCPSPESTTNSWLNTDATGHYKTMLQNFLSTYKPKYMFLGNEINDFSDATEYGRFVTWYNANYADIKASNPNTKIGVVFQYEKLAGYEALNGGGSAQWSKLTDFDLDKLDVIGLTVYPFFNYANASSIPTTYFDDLYENLGDTYKPLVITESGWPSEDDFSNPSLPQWNVTEAQQVTFVGNLNKALANWEVPVLGFLSLYPLADSEVGGYEIFHSVSLLKDDDSRKQVYDVWIGQATRKRIKGR